ncbi:MAG: hypothetical protein WC813_00225 [Patescibacteria group bacterium]
MENVDPAPGVGVGEVRMLVPSELPLTAKLRETFSFPDEYTAHEDRKWDRGNFWGSVEWTPHDSLEGLEVCPGWHTFRLEPFYRCVDAMAWRARARGWRVATPVEALAFDVLYPALKSRHEIVAFGSIHSCIGYHGWPMENAHLVIAKRRIKDPEQITGHIWFRPGNTHPEPGKGDSEAMCLLVKI